MNVDETLVSAALRLIDGGKGHHYYLTVSRYRQAARDGNAAEFASCERMLAAWVLNSTQQRMPDSYRAAVADLCQQVNGNAVPCGACGRGKAHGTRCPGTRPALGGSGGQPCWALADACEGSGGMCCRCAAAAAAGTPDPGNMKGL